MHQSLARLPIGNSNESLTKSSEGSVAVANGSPKLARLPPVLEKIDSGERGMYASIMAAAALKAKV